MYLLSPQLSASIASLIEVKESSELNLVECSLSNLAFTHPTLGTAIHLKKGSTFTFTSTSSPFSSITSQGKGSCVLLDVDGSTEVNAAVTLLQNWAPTRAASRFTPDEKNRFVARFENGSVDELIYHWFPYDNKTMHVHADGGSHEKCGLDVLPCGSLSVGLEHVGVERQIDVDGDIVETAALSAFSADTLIQSPPYTTHILTVSKETSFKVVSCDVSFHRLSFVPFIPSSPSNEDTPVRDTSLFSLTSGTLSLSSCSFSSFVLASDPLITHSDGSLSLESCCVSSVSRQSGRGSVLATTLKGGMGLSLPDLTFSSMPSTAESVAILLSCHSIQTQSELTSFNLTNMKFGESADAATRFVEIVGNDLSKLISENDAAFANSFSSSLSLDFLWSVDEQFELPASLLFYHLPQEGPIGVERGGLEMDRCGYNSVWCRSIEKSLERMVVQNTEVMEVRGDADLNASLALARPLHMRGMEENATLHVDSEGSLSSSLHHTLTAELLIVSLPATHNPLAVFISSSGLLKLSMIVITSTTPSNAQLVRVSGGQAELVRLTMNAGMSTNTEAIHIASGDVHVSYLTLNSPITKNQTIVRMTDGSVNVTQVSLTTSAPVDGRLFDLSGSSIDLSSIKLTNHVFTDTPFVFSSFASASLVEVHAQNCTASHLIEAKDSDDLTLRLCSFTDSLTHVSQNDESSSICAWTNSVLDLQNCSTHLHYTEMTCLSQGAVTVREGTLTLTSCTFTSNTPPNTSFPSIRRNIQCEDGSVLVGSPTGDGDASNPNHWISTKNCSVEKESRVVAAPLFIPTLDTAGSKSVLNKSRKEYDVSVKGEMLVPCGLRVEIFEHVAVNKTSFVEGESFELIVELDESRTWNETSFEFAVPQATIADLNKKHDIRCRLVYGLEQRTASFSLTRSGDDKMSQAGRTLSLVIPIVCAVLLAVILLIVMVVVLRRRKQKKEGVPAKELDDTANFEEEVKFDVLDNQTTANNLVHGSVEEAHQNQSMLAVSHAKSHSMNSVTEGTTRTVVAEHVMAIRCEGDNSEVAVNRADTLYRALHVTRRLDLNKALIRRQLVAGLEKVLRDEAYVELVTRLSPHWILFDESGKLMMKKSEGQTMVGNTTKESEEDRRWNAPEQEDKEKMEAGSLFDVRKAAVFRLGLVLWELETELVPFGELDAVNASRQMKAGVVPRIHNWEDAELAELVGECLSFNPNERPTLSDLRKRLSEEKLQQPPPADDLLLK
ncbi:hypothetical protein BLNAU_8512 [Blattamonas nauphoetae]|uniref:Serine-threonine/tyrosine-protein kinase catalytic domain-containing protein n=1 Tax=Blattamonas nauphoetae TaxID=2049346 RepID=A0ABQ9XYC1_9EUKA|nr:hypothetical protein BLNAU_8512 [Blattamonas nauphoetae]